jgi:hypothetical protein
VSARPPDGTAHDRAHVAELTGLSARTGWPPRQRLLEDRVRTDKAMGLRNLPSHDWTVNQGWVSPPDPPTRSHGHVQPSGKLGSSAKNPVTEDP